MTDQSAATPPIVAGYGYFLLRLRLAPPTTPPSFAGVVERLGSGEQRRFESADDLLRLLGSGRGDPSEPPALAEPHALKQET